MATTDSKGTIRLSDVISALSFALDLTEGQPMGHSIRSCILGMRIAQELGLNPQGCSDLYYALLLKDSGCSSNAARLQQILGGDEIKAKQEAKLEDWTKPSLAGFRYLSRHVMPQAPLWRRAARIVKLAAQHDKNSAELVRTRCERGAEIARKIGLGDATAQAIRSLDEHWDGSGYSEGRKGEQIPLLSRILSVSQTLEVFATHAGPRSGPKVAIGVVCQRSGTWFDPEIVRVVRRLENDHSFWQNVMGGSARQHVLEMEPGIGIPASGARIDSLCLAFAEVIDAKSPYTFNHSLGVTAAALEIAHGLGLAPATVTTIRRAALLHDIGKLSVSNTILEKPGSLTPAEWDVVKQHPVYTRIILETISGFEHLAFIAGAHHERLDGSGYPNRLRASDLPLTARIIAVADVFGALTERRPYRESLPLDQVFEIMGKEAPNRLDADCLAVLQQNHSNAMFQKISEVDAMIAASA